MIQNFFEVGFLDIGSSGNLLGVEWSHGTFARTFSNIHMTFLPSRDLE